MKSQISKINFKPNRGGFALIVTLTLMVLLTILALGLLTLSSITLRASTRENELSIAKANARLALQLAIADLQKNAGPDNRITATASTILENKPGQAMLTGVWESRKLDPNSPDKASDQDKQGRSNHFRKWLISSGDPAATEKQDFASSSPDKTEVLISTKVVGADPNAIQVPAQRVNVMDTEKTTRVRGTYAYAVLDEGVKARVNLGTKGQGVGLAEQASALGGGQQPGIDRLNLPAGAGKFSLASVDMDLSTTPGKSLVNKICSRGNSELGFKLDLATAAKPGAMGKHFHDLTPYSLGLLTNAAEGGFKRDLSLMAELSQLPVEYKNKKIYETSFGGEFKAPSDPGWDQAISFAKLYKAKTHTGADLLYKLADGSPAMRVSAPKTWSAGTFAKGGSATPTSAPPPGSVLLPSIAKVQVVFSICARDIYTYPKPAKPAAPYAFTEKEPALDFPWGGYSSTDTTNGPFRKTKFDYLLHLTYTPIVTLHNPYNVPIEFGTGATNYLKIDFVNVPMAIQVFRNNAPMSNDLVPFSAMYQGLIDDWKTMHVKDANPSKRFGLRLASGVDSSGKPNGQPIRLLPGEVKTFSAWIPETRTWAQEAENPKYFNDWASSQSVDGVNNTEWSEADTSNAVGIPGWRGDGLGYDLFCWVPGPPYNKDINTKEPEGCDRQFTIPLKATDNVHLEFAPIVNPNSLKPTPGQPAQPPRFTVEMTLMGANSDTKARTSVHEFQIEDLKGLQTKLLGADKKLRYPAEGEINTMALFDHASTPVKDIGSIKPFALFSAYAKTTHGGQEVEIADGTTMLDNGRYAAKPWLFNNHTGVVSTQKILNENSSQHSREINLTRLPGNTNEAIDVQADTGRGNYITGHTATNGRRFGTFFDIPLGPIQSPTAFNVAGLATSIYQPCFAQPVGNSYAHPLLNTSSLELAATGGKLVDHSYLLNSIFYDGYYCSGIQTHSSAFGDGKDAKTLAGSFFKDQVELTDPRLVPYLADGGTNDQAIDSVIAADGYKKAAAYQLVKGAFNVNSTSEDAWKAELSAMSGKAAKVFDVVGDGSASYAAGIKDLKSNANDFLGARFSRFRLPNSQAVSTGNSDTDNEAVFWQGARDLTEPELTKLAAEIVVQVKKRGPFLSMGEFVNRQLGPTGELTLAGALQTAIDKSGINQDPDKYKAGYMIDSSKVKDLGLATSQALEGSSAAGAPGYLMQADIMNVLGNAATVRSDTFVIRTYGDARDANGIVTARAWCEAVVQRVPEYVDGTDAATTLPADLVGIANKTFGRRFLIQSFRYLRPDEV